MKTTSSYLLILVLLLTTIQITKGQTFDLGPAAEDSTLIKHVDSLKSAFLTNYNQIAPIRSISSDAQNLFQNEIEQSVTNGAGPMLLYYSNLHPHIPNSFSINTSKTVGEIPLQHQVAPNGATTYTVPIECAPGRAGAQPSVALSYNSLAGDGVLGYGWNIGGLSSIHRTTSNLHYDGTVKPTEMTATAQFVLDGERLIQTATSSTVRTFAPVQGNITIEAYMSGAVTKFFKVWFSNGSTAIYGYHTNTTAN